MVTTPAATQERRTKPPPRFTRKQRVLIAIYGWLGYLLIRLIGLTLRYRVSIEEGGPTEAYIQPAIYPLWHECMISALFYYRGRGVPVMSSPSFDAEYTARILQRFGYTLVKGSSSKGAVRAILGMQKALQAGKTITLTIDGPRGPRHVAKPGPVLLAKNTGVPIVCFHVAVKPSWVVRSSWDQLQIPKPFSRALLRASKLIYVPRDADSAAMERYHAEMQAALERAREFAEANV
ncbi:MAG: lysophospholipid acyltransferase family protein [Acidobacteria bacterium]|nr:lysophospholipid acyltransferase family protein [Acidobacteriota bacterium]